MKQIAKFVRPMSFISANASFREREGILIRERGENGRGWTYGEASPLKLYSAESIDDCWRYLRGSEEAPPAAVRFAVASAHQWEEILAGPTISVKSNAVLDLASSAGSRISDLFLAGFEKIKIKISPENFDEVIRSIHEERDAYPGKSIRLDANASFSADSAREVASALRKLPLDYVEDPCPLDGKSWSIFRENGVSTAWDQGLDAVDSPDKLKGEIPFDVAILKPTVLGGEKDLRKAIDGLRMLGKRTVFTAALESEVGRISVIYFASKFAPEETHGLSTGGYFQDSFIADSPSYSGPFDLPKRWHDWADSLSWEEMS